MDSSSALTLASSFSSSITCQKKLLTSFSINDKYTYRYSVYRENVVTLCIRLGQYSNQFYCNIFVAIELATGKVVKICLHALGNLDFEHNQMFSVNKD